jgi:serine/threonine protein kinase
VIQQLGAGGFSQTFLAKDTQLPGQPLCVVKQLKLQVKNADRWQVAKRLFDTEASVLYRLGNHNQIPRLLAHFEDNQEFFLVQEFIEGEPLDKLLLPHVPWTETQVMRRLHDLLHILAFVHQQRVIHRDIKPSNLIRRRQDDKLVLIDFGAVKQVSASLDDPAVEQAMTISIGTQGYMPSEQVSGSPRFNSDLYAAGMVGIQALTGIRPNRLQRDPQTCELIWRDRLPSSPIDPAFADILDQLVRYHFKDRYATVEEPLAAIANLLAGREAEAVESEVAAFTGTTVSWEPQFESEETSAVPENASLLAPQPSAFATSFSEVANADDALLPSVLLPDRSLPDRSPSDLQPFTGFSDSAPAEQSLPFDSSNSGDSSDLGKPALAAATAFTQATPTLVAAPPQSDRPAKARSVRLVAVQLAPWLFLLSGVLGAIALSIHPAKFSSQPIAASPTSPLAPSPEQQLKPSLPNLPCREPPPPPLPTVQPDLEFPNGTRYYGRLEAGRPADGKATMVFSKGNRYDGQFQNGKRNGCGTYSFTNGKRYIGQFKADQFDGLGIWLLGNGDRYVGGFKSNRCDGEGIFLFKDGNFTRGTWKDGKQVDGTLSCNR